MNRTVVNKTESMVRVVVDKPGQWSSVHRQMIGGGPTELARIQPGDTYVIPREYDYLPVLVETPANFLSRVTVEIDPSVRGEQSS